MSTNKLQTKPISLPCLRGLIGDWYYYITLLTFNEVRNRVFTPSEIDERYASEDLRLGDWIQRDIDPKRLNQIVNYLKNQEQRFFNSLVLGIYGGNPSWQEISFTHSQKYDSIREEDLNYFAKTFGILTLSGEEDIFAIDGQHRAMGIRMAVNEDNSLGGQEIAAIFVAHRTDEDGKVRTRRLFSTLNKYAKPVNKSEIIALSEDNNCAIITRQFIEIYPHFKGRILINKNRSIHPDNISAFTNILTLYDCIERILTNKQVHSIQVDGRPHYSYTNSRASDEIIQEDMEKIINIFDKITSRIPPLSDFISTGIAKRKNKDGNLLFRPIGQNILFDILKVALKNDRFDNAIEYFSQTDFSLNHVVWGDVFWDKETEGIVTDKSRQRYAVLLILEKLGIKIDRTRKDIEIYQNFHFSIDDI